MSVILGETEDMTGVIAHNWDTTGGKVGVSHIWNNPEWGLNALLGSLKGLQDENHAVVIVQTTLGKAVYVGQYRLDYMLGRGIALPADRIHQPFLRILVSIDVHRLCNSVGVADEDVPRTELEIPARVSCVGHDTHHYAPLSKFHDRSVPPDHQGRDVARIYILEATTPMVEHANEYA